MKVARSVLRGEGGSDAPNLLDYPRTGLTANFTLTFPDSTATYNWDFGDGNSAIGMNPIHTYASEGIYEACLIGSNNIGADTTCMYLSVTANTSCLYADSLELVAFYYATGGVDYWANKWDLNAPVSTWYGVTVNGCGVICLDLDGYPGCTPNITTIGGNNLVGNLVDLNIPSLITISFSHNQLSGAVPDFTRLNNLKTLRLNNNQLTGDVPNFTNLNKLTGLTLGQNLLTGNIPDFVNMPNLVQLFLDDNPLSGSIPDFSNLSNLTTLWLRDSPLSGNVPDFSNLPSIKYLLLDNNELSGTVPDFSNLTSLTFVRAYGNRFNFEHLAPNLIKNLAINDFLYAPQDSIPLLQNNNTLSVDAGDIQNNTYIWYKDGIPQDTIVGDSTYIPVLSGNYNCRVENAIVTRQQANQNLFLWSEEIYFSLTVSCLESDSLALVDFYNAAGGDDYWTNKWDLTKPVSTWYGVILDAGGCRVTHLDMDGNPNGVFDCCSTGNNLTGNLVDLNLPYLEKLLLSRNQLSGAIPDFSNLSNLRDFRLGYNQLSGTIPDLNLPNLEHFWAHYNQLTGPLPSFNNLPSLLRLYLHNNQLNGGIPEFSNFPNLEYLWFHNNQLSGTIPDFSNIPNLYWVYLLANKFDFGDLSVNINSNLSIPLYRYSPQATIPIQLVNNTLSVNAGDTQNNTYIWYKDGIPQDTIAANNSYMPTLAGNYNCRVENAVITIPQLYQELYLWSEVVYFNGANNLEVSGTITNCNGQALSPVTLNLVGGNTQSSNNSANGDYSFNGLTSDNYSLSPSFNNGNTLTGLNGLDILLIQRHILGITPFSESCKLLSADVNEDCIIDNDDIEWIRQIILGYSQDFPSGKVWRFLPSNYSIPVGTFPCNAPEAFEYTPLFQNQLNQDFIGTKLGDVN